MERLVTVVNQEDIKRAAEEPIKELSSTKSCCWTISNKLALITWEVGAVRNGRVPVVLEELCTSLLDSGEISYAEVSKFEVIMILAKCKQLQGYDFEVMFEDYTKKYFNQISL